MPVDVVFGVSSFLSVLLMHLELCKGFPAVNCCQHLICDCCCGLKLCLSAAVIHVAKMAGTQQGR